MISKKAILEFQAIYQSEFGKTISFEEAEKCASNLVRLYKAVYSIRGKKGEVVWEKDNMLLKQTVDGEFAVKVIRV